MSLLLPLVILIFSLAPSSTSSSPVLCHDIDRSALLLFKQTLSVNLRASSDPSAYPKSLTWKPTLGNESDCCLWDGVLCGRNSGRVTGLDLSSSYLYGPIPSNSTLFQLVYLQSLDLSDNDFRYSLIHSELGRLVNLKYLNLSQSMFFGQVPIQVFTLSKLISLDLSLNVDPSSGSQLLKLQSPSLEDLAAQNLTSLEVLRLSEVNMSSPVPGNIANLISLRSLRLFNCSMYGPLPQGIFLLPRLEVLSLGFNIFSGQIPPSIGNLSSLEVLYLKDCSFEGPIPDSIGKLSKLTYLELSSNNLAGHIPPSIGNLSSLEVLYLNDCSFEGPIPDSIGKLSKLTVLELSSNNLAGQIPPSIGNLSSLEVLYLNDCSFEGPIPDSIGKLSKLTVLELSSNNLAGNIPASLSNLTQLQTLDLSYNSLVGEALPLANLTELEFLVLSGNMLEGSIGGFISGLNRLILLFVQENSFVSPLEFDMLIGHKNLQALVLSNIDLIFSSSTRNSTNYPQFAYLWLEACNMKRLPDFLHNQTRLAILSLPNNNIQGPLLPPPPSLLFYYMWKNEFSGNIPTTFCNASSLRYLDLLDNFLSGGIPPCLFNLSNSNLQSLSLGENDLFGTIPETFTSSCKLMDLSVQFNRIGGAIPRSLVNCTSLIGIQLSHNNINDTFPIWLSALPSLQVIYIESNQIHGPIPAHFRHGFFLNLHVLDLENNMLTGYLPEEFFLGLYAMQNNSQTWPNELTIVPFFLFGRDLSVPINIRITEDTNPNEAGVFANFVVFIDLLNNSLVGSIPASIGNLTRLQGLYLSSNNLTGSIPSSFGFLSNLEILDLSHNKLSGQIPQQLAGLTFLRLFNVSYNQLVGPVPNGQQFNTFTATSFVGNPGLCGAPLPKKCGIVEAPQDEPRDSGIGKHKQESLEVIDWVIRSLGYLGGLVAGLILGRIMTTENHEWFVKTFGRERAGRRKKRHRRT